MLSAGQKSRVLHQTSDSRNVQQVQPPARWLSGWVCRSSCFNRRLNFLMQHHFGYVVSRLKALGLPHAELWPALAWRSLISPLQGTGLCLSQFHCSLQQCTTHWAEPKILCTLKCLALMVALSLTTQRANGQRVHQPMEGMEGEVGQTHKRVSQSNGVKQPNDSFILTKVVKSLSRLLWKLSIYGKLHSNCGNNRNLSIN